MTNEQEAVLRLLHEKGHCLSNANWNGTRAGLAEPDAAKLGKDATPSLVKSLTEKSYAGAYTLLWMAKLDPTRSRFPQSPRRLA